MTTPAPLATELTMWSKPACVQCNGAEMYFMTKKLTPTKKALLDSPEDLAAFKAAGLMQAPILQFPEVAYDGEVIFEAQTVTGNRVDIIDQYSAALAKVAA